MSENINFIPANELPVAEGDEVSVLCLENGELKQKAANGLGGGGNPEYDLVIRITLAYNEDEHCTTIESHEIISGSFDAVVQKLDAYAIPSCLVFENGTDDGNREIKTVYECLPAWETTPDGMPRLNIEGRSCYYLLFEDGTVEKD